MSAQTDSVPVAARTPGTPSGPRALSRETRDEQAELELIARISAGDEVALRELATRMAPRVEKVARALMGGSLDARDAAHHALIELLRSAANYRGKQRLERWGDRIAALCVMRFARAVSRRNGAFDSMAAHEPGNERAARTFEQYLGMLTDLSRQILLLRHALGFSIPELADAMQCSPQSARERLMAARREFRGLVRRREGSLNTTGAQLIGSPSNMGIGLGAQRWCALRDREAVGEPLLPDEVEEVALLEAREPEIWAFVAQVRALELYFDTRAETKPPIDGTLIDRAVEALEVSSPTLQPRALVDDSGHDSRTDHEGSNWVGVLAWAVSALLAAASALALYWHRPEAKIDAAMLKLTAPRAPVAAQPVAAPAPPPRPIVERLPSARTASRGAHLRRAGRSLSEGSVLGQGDTVEAIDKAGCLEIEPAFEACLAPGSALTLTALQAGSRQLTLVRGRVVVRGNEDGPLLSVRVDGVDAGTSRGALAVERASDGTVVRARALRGRVTLHSPKEERTFDEGDGAQVRMVDGAVIVAAAPSASIQRDWETLATGLHAVAPPTPRPARAVARAVEAAPQERAAEAAPEAVEPEAPAEPEE